jgi:hypothetical protein
MFRKYMFVLLSLSIVLSSCGKSNDVVRASQSESADSQVPTDHEERTKIPQTLGWTLPTKIAVGSAIAIGIAVVAIAGVVACKIYDTPKKWNEWNNDEEVGFKCVAENLRKNIENFGCAAEELRGPKPTGVIGFMGKLKEVDSFEALGKPAGTFNLLEGVTDKMAENAKSFKDLNSKRGYNEAKLTKYYFETDNLRKIDSESQPQCPLESFVCYNRDYYNKNALLLVEDKSISSLYFLHGNAYGYFSFNLEMLENEILLVQKEIQNPSERFDSKTHPKEHRFLSKVEKYLYRRYNRLRDVVVCCRRSANDTSRIDEYGYAVCFDAIKAKANSLPSDPLPSNPE